MLGRPVSRPGRSVAWFVVAEAGSRGRRWKRRRAAPPDPQGRTWLHPSELPDFSALPSDPRPPPPRGVRWAGAILIVAVTGLAAALATARTSVPPDQPMTANTATQLSALPGSVRLVAARTVDLSFTLPDHVTTTSALVLPDGLAVTPTPIPSTALVTAWTARLGTFAATWIGHDTVMGFTIVRLTRHVPAPRLGALPADAAVTALSPVVTGPTARARFTWSATTLGDPVVHAAGVVSYLATPSVANLNGVPGALAVDAQGNVVAVLGSQGQWFAARFVARVADIVATGHGCHASLNVATTSAQGGGAQVTNVPRASQARGHVNVGDVITVIDGHAIDSASALDTYLYLTAAGGRAHLTVVRGTATRHVVVRLACGL